MRLRVVLDTNVLVSGFAYPAGTPGRLLSLMQHGGLNVVLSRYILDETMRVLPGLARIQLTRDQVRDLVESLVFMAELVEPDGKKDLRLRDAADQQVLGTLRASRADYLITGDRDLLTLADIYPILSPSAFWDLHG